MGTIISVSDCIVEWSGKTPSNNLPLQGNGLAEKVAFTLENHLEYSTLRPSPIHAKDQIAEATVVSANAAVRRGLLIP
jgi:hypothetical protein